MSTPEYSKENFDYLLSELNKLVDKYKYEEMSKEVKKLINVKVMESYNHEEIDQSLTEEEENEIYLIVRDRLSKNKNDVVELDLNVTEEEFLKNIEKQGLKK